VRAIQAKFEMSERWACALVGLGRSTCRHRTHPPDWPALLEPPEAGRPTAPVRLSAAVRTIPAGSYPVNLKRVYRLYREEGLTVRRRGLRRRIARGIPDCLARPGRFRLLAVVDDFARACLAIEVDTSLGGRPVVQVLQRLLESHGKPTVLLMDNGPEFIGRGRRLGLRPRGFACTSSTPASRTRMPTSRTLTAGSAMSA
jgi:putative transposase